VGEERLPLPPRGKVVGNREIGEAWRGGVGRRRRRQRGGGGGHGAVGIEIGISATEEDQLFYFILHEQDQLSRWWTDRMGSKSEIEFLSNQSMVVYRLVN
jgi:hypothetical protein